MPRQKTLQDVLRRLRDAAELIDGRRCVRACTAARLIGMTDGRLRDWERLGRVRRVEVPVPPSRRDPRGLRVYYPLEDTEAAARRRLTRRDRQPITEAERRRVRQMVGLHTVEDIAAAIGRTPRAVRWIIATDEAGLYDALAQEHGLLTVRAFGRLVRRDRAVVKRWIAELGMPAQRRPGRQRQYLVRLPDAREWLANRPLILVQLHPDVRRLLRLTPRDLEQTPAPGSPGKEAAA